MIDAARGCAILLMVIYHGCWDLNLFGLTSFRLFTDPWWLGFRTLVLSSFLILVGVGLVLGLERGFRLRAFVRRLALLVTCAALISTLGYWIFPQSPIFFGVLHHIALASVLGLAFVRLPAALTAVVAVAAWLAPSWLADPMFNAPWLRWIGLMTHEPNSNDYVPLLPWFGVVLGGIAAARLALDMSPRLVAEHPTEPSRWRHGRVLEAFGWAGRHSLILYMVHQPVLLGLLYGASLAAGGFGPSAYQTEEFITNCRRSCAASGTQSQNCTGSCQCLSDGIISAKLWHQAMQGRLAAKEREMVDGIIERCRTAHRPPAHQNR